jgi:hypothetical protein
MARGLFTLKQQLQGLQQKAWNDPIGTYAGSFNGTSQYLTTTMTGQTFGTGDFTVEFWVNPASIATSDIIDTRSAGDSINAYSVQFDGTNLNWANTANYLSVPVSNFPLGKWTHVAYTRVSGTMKVYVNGTQYGSSITLASDYTNTRLDIGIAVRTYYFSGFISNIRLVRGTAIYISNFAPPVGPLAAVSGTALLTLQNATIIDNSTNAFAITNTGSVTTGAAMPFTQLKTPAVDYLVVAGGGSSGGSLGAGGGAGGLLHGSVPVTAGSAITVTVGAGGAQPTASTIGNNGTNSVFGSISATGGGGGGQWAGGFGASGGSGGGGNTSNGGSGNVGGQGIVGQGNSGGTVTGVYNYYAMGAGGGGAGTAGLGGSVQNSLSSAIGFNGGAGIASAILGTVYTWAGGGGGFTYGAQNETGGNGGVGGGGGGGVGGNATFTYGQGGSGYNSGTTPSVIYNGGNGGTNSGGGGGGSSVGNSGTGGIGGSGIVIVSYPDIYAGAASTTGSPTVSTSGSGSLYFAGSSNYLTYASNAAFGYGTGNFTEEVWIYPTASNWTSGNFYISDHGGNLLQLQYYLNALNWNSGAIVGSTTIPANTWSHIAVVRNSTTVVLYLNGTNIGSASSSTNFATTSLTIGSYGGGGAGNSYQGYISNFRAVKGTAVYTGNFTPSTTPLTAITNTSLLLNSVSGAYLADGSTNAFVPTVTGTAPWNQASPFATGLGYKNRVYTWTSSGSVTF